MVSIAKVASPGMVRPQRFPPHSQLLVRLGRSEIMAVFEQIQVNRQPAGVQRIPDPFTALVVDLRHFRRPVGLSQGHAKSQFPGVQNQPRHVMRELDLQLQSL